LTYPVDVSSWKTLTYKLAVRYLELIRTCILPITM
jgi:hypothetical protein